MNVITTSLTVSNAIIIKAMKAYVMVTPMKLQKLLYMIYARYLAVTETSLFADRFEAWQYGPVVPDVYNEFKHYGRSGISVPSVSNDGMIYYTLEKDVYGNCFQDVWRKYRTFSGVQLSTVTHERGSAWSKKQLGEFLDDGDIANDGKRWFP